MNRNRCRRESLKRRVRWRVKHWRARWRLKHWRELAVRVPLVLLRMHAHVGLHAAYLLVSAPSPLDVTLARVVFRGMTGR
jgi:hypothetical protein